MLMGNPIESDSKTENIRFSEMIIVEETKVPKETIGVAR